SRSPPPRHPPPQLPEESTMARTPGIRKRGDSWEAWVWDRREKKKIRRTFANFDEARSWRHDAASGVRKGTLRAPTATTLRAAWEAWLEAARRGEILNRNRVPFKPSTLRGYSSDMDPLRARRLRRAPAQRAPRRRRPGAHRPAAGRGALRVEGAKRARPVAVALPAPPARGSGRPDGWARPAS